MNLDNVPTDLRDRAWYSHGDTYVFLVDKPITFGHSQLRVATAPTQHEETSFATAAIHVVKCIRILRQKLSKVSFEDWRALADYTETSGRYMKTLVLKASAQDSPDEYKIHLVPYFDSHLEATKTLYWSGKEPPPRHAELLPGGLLHWVGQREWIADYDGNRDPGKRRVSSFDLPRLANLLRIGVQS